MSQSHRIKGGATDEAFKERCFLWEIGASVGADFNHVNFQDSYTGQKVKNHKSSPLSLSCVDNSVNKSTINIFIVKLLNIFKHL